MTKQLAKSRINQHTFDACTAIQVNGKKIIKGWVDNKTVYFIETRHPWGGHLTESLTVTSLNQLKKAL